MLKMAVLKCEELYHSCGRRCGRNFCNSEKKL